MSELNAERGRPSRFFEAHFDVLAQAAKTSRLLDLACGRGRHALAAAERGLHVVALDRNADLLEELSRVPIAAPGRIETCCFDLESGHPAEAGLKGFGAIVVSRYLHRPLMPWIVSLLDPGGVLLYETFTTEQRTLGWGPKRDAFLLREGELATAFPGLEILVYEEGPSADEPAAQTARLLARKSEASRLRQNSARPSGAR